MSIRFFLRLFGFGMMSSKRKRREKEKKKEKKKERKREVKVFRAFSSLFLTE